MKKKNYDAIDRIIERLSLRDFNAVWGGLTERQREDFRKCPGEFSYTLGADTMEAVSVKRAWLHDEISEETYKRYCLEMNLYGHSIVTI